MSVNSIRVDSELRVDLKPKTPSLQLDFVGPTLISSPAGGNSPHPLPSWGGGAHSHKFILFGRPVAQLDKLPKTACGLRLKVIK